MLQDAAWQARIACVLSGALRLWGLDGTVEPEAEQPGAFVLAVRGATEMRIVNRAPHGWLVFRGRASQADTLGVHAGLPGLLRQLREELAPHAKAGRLIIGAQSL
jgi:hypothetical protein